eukprot:scaffold32931_cov62-Phaeocystis_antarctica.AAC.3
MPLNEGGPPREGPGTHAAAVLALVLDYCARCDVRNHSPGIRKRLFPSNARQRGEWQCRPRRCPRPCADAQPASGRAASRGRARRLALDPRWLECARPETGVISEPRFA